MARIFFTIIVAIAIQDINCAPKNSKQINATPKLDEPKLNDNPYSIFESDGVVKNKETQGQRHKRWFEIVPFNYYPPPFSRPYHVDSERENSFSYIEMRLQEILNILKSPPPTPPPSLYPVYVPIYIPQISCGCDSVNNDEPLPMTTTKPPEQTTKININPPQNETIPSLHDRLPEIEDERQNLGLLINNSLVDFDDDDDGNRPISLTPISTSNDNGRPAPPVEHGSIQADISAETQLTTTTPPGVAFLENSVQPSVCDRAVLSCCLGPDPTYKCIQLGGCQERFLSENPCSPQYMLSVISRVQSYYG